MSSSFDLVLISLSQDLQCSLVDFSRSQHNIVSSNGRAVLIHANMIQYDIYFNNFKQYIHRNTTTNPHNSIGSRRLLFRLVLH